MQFIGGIYSGAWKITFTCCDANQQWVSANTRAAWEAARKDDPDARFFIAPLLEDENGMPDFYLDGDLEDDSCCGSC